MIPWLKNSLAVAAQPKVEGMRVEIVLVAEIGLIEFADEVVEQGNGNDEWNIFETISFDHLQHFLLFIR